MHAVLLVQNLIELTFASLAGGSTLITLNPALQMANQLQIGETVQSYLDDTTSTYW